MRRLINPTREGDRYREATRDMPYVGFPVLRVVLLCGDILQRCVRLAVMCQRALAFCRGGGDFGKVTHSPALWKTQCTPLYRIFLGR